jgi:HEAT repeat protein
MRNGDRSREWLNALGKIGVHETDLIQYLSDELPLYYEKQDVAAAIDALSILGPNWHAPDYSQDLTKKITNQITQHIDSTDLNVRRAAIASMSKFPQMETSAILLEAMADPSEQIRKTALRVLSFNDLRSSDEIKPSLLTVMNSETESFAIRELAWMALNGVHLVGDEQDQFLKFFRLIKDQQ